MFLCVFCLCSSSSSHTHIWYPTTTPVRCSRIFLRSIIIIIQTETHTTRKKRGFDGRRRRRKEKKKTTTRDKRKKMWRGGGGGGGGGAFFARTTTTKTLLLWSWCWPNLRFDDSWSSSSLKKRRARGGGGVWWSKRKGGRMKSAGDGIDGVSTDEEKVVVRFWHHFGSSRKCAEKRAAKGSTRTTT